MNRSPEKKRGLRCLSFICWGQQCTFCVPKINDQLVTSDLVDKTRSSQSERCSWISMGLLFRTMSIVVMQSRVRSRSQQSYVQIMGLPTTDCVTMEKLPMLFTHLQKKCRNNYLPCRHTVKLDFAGISHIREAP